MPVLGSRTLFDRPVIGIQVGVVFGARKRFSLVFTHPAIPTFMAESGNPRRAEAAQTFRCPQGKLPDQGPLATVSPAPDPACDWLQLGADG